MFLANYEFYTHIFVLELPMVVLESWKY